MIGVEGYVESVVSGLFVGINAVCFVKGEELIEFFCEMILGSMVYYIIYVEGKYF